MKIIQKIFSMLFAVIGAIFFIMGVFMLVFMDDNTLDHTMDNNHIIENSFKQSVAFLQKYQKENNRLPSQLEFDKWAGSQKQMVYGVDGIQLLTNSYPDAAIEKFGAPDTNAYLLVMWRGEYSEYYASWTNTTSLSFNKKDYYMLNYWWADALLILSIGITLCVLSWLTEYRLTRQINMEH